MTAHEDYVCDIAIADCEEEEEEQGGASSMSMSMLTICSGSTDKTVKLSEVVI